MIRQIPYWEVENVWKDAEPLITKVVAVQDEWDLRSVYQKLVNPHDPMPFQLWLGGEFALITQVQAFPSGKRKCLLFMCGGEDIAAIAAAQPTVEDWARRFMGCQKLMISGRPGWLKVLDGFKATNTVMEKELCR